MPPASAPDGQPGTRTAQVRCIPASSRLSALQGGAVDTPCSSPEGFCSLSLNWPCRPFTRPPMPSSGCSTPSYLNSARRLAIRTIPRTIACTAIVFWAIPISARAQATPAWLEPQRECAPPHTLPSDTEKATESLFFASTRSDEQGRSVEPPELSFGYLSAEFIERKRVRFFDGMDGQLNWKTTTPMRVPIDDWIAKIQDSFSGCKVEPCSLLIYVHGFANSFSDAMCRVAEITHRTRFQGVTVLFSWPAEPLGYKNLFSGYSHDQRAALASVPKLTELLLKLREKIPTDRTILLAHSMGSLVLEKALSRVPPDADGRKYQSVALLAPDIETQDLIDAQATTIQQRATRTTVYFDATDIALFLSRVVNGRGGRAGRAPTTAPGIEWIDVGRATRGYGSWLNHSDQLESTSLYDLVWNVFRNVPARCRAARGLSIPMTGYSDAWTLNRVDEPYQWPWLTEKCELEYPLPQLVHP